MKINLLVLMVILAFIEVFFQINFKYNFLKNSNFYVKVQETKTEKENLNKVYEVPAPYNTRYEQRLYDYRNAQIEAKNVYPTPYAEKNKSYTITKRLSNLDRGVVYKAHYQFDEFERRRVENQDHKKSASQFIMALGDSFTFGEGLDQGFDYPSILAKKINNNYKVYNFGFHGNGAGDIYNKLINDPNYLSGVDQKSGTAIWYFIPAHFERFFCSLNCQRFEYSMYISNKIRYKWKKDHFESLGSFSEDYSLYRFFLRILSYSKTLYFFKINIPREWSEEQLQDFVKMLVEIRKKISNEKDIKKFLFVNKEYFKQKARLIEILKNNDFEIIDLAGIPQLDGELGSIPVDWHPTALSNWILTENIKDKIQ